MPSAVVSDSNSVPWYFKKERDAEFTWYAAHSHGRHALDAGNAGFADEECGWANYKLPRNIRPDQYDLDLSVQLQDPFLVAGAVVVHANVSKPSKCIVLHAMRMNITRAARLDSPANGEPLQLSSCCFFGSSCSTSGLP